LLNGDGTQVEHIHGIVNGLMRIVITFLKVSFLQILIDGKKIRNLLWSVLG